MNAGLLCVKVHEDQALLCPPLRSASTPPDSNEHTLEARKVLFHWDTLSTSMRFSGMVVPYALGVDTARMFRKAGSGTKSG